MFCVDGQIIQSRTQWNRHSKIAYLDLRGKGGDRISGTASPVSVQIDANLGRRNSGRGNEHLIRRIFLGSTDARILISSRQRLRCSFDSGSIYAAGEIRNGQAADLGWLGDHANEFR